ncbi:unnamed protein product [Rotaria sp. Silwood1]|nr:unnamed protein product [Rotaria sp. Silwood1]
MSGFDSDSENKPLPTMKELNASPSSSSTSQKEHYQTQEIEKLLRMSVKSKQYVVKKNSSQLIKSDAWSKFGFPAKQRSENVYDIIPMYAILRCLSVHRSGAIQRQPSSACFSKIGFKRFRYFSAITATLFPTVLADTTSSCTSIGPLYF